MRNIKECLKNQEVTTLLRTSKRESNIELLRIICMLLIIAHHCVLHGGGVNMDFCSNKWFAIFLIPGGKICFNTFLAISMWFLVDQEFKAQRFAKIWFQSLFYSILFSFVAYLMGVEFTIKDVISIFLPITGNVHGFAAAYLLLYALLPFLGLVRKHVTKTQLQILLLFLFIADVFSLVVGNYTEHFQKIYCNVGFWIFCYFLIYYLKKYPPAILSKQVLLVLLFVCVWLTIVVLWIGKALYPDNIVIKYLLSISSSHTGILFIIGGFALFFAFKNIKISYSFIVNTLAKTTFGVLLIHDHNFFRTPLWDQIIKAPDWWYSQLYPIRIGMTVLFIFCTCAAIDLVRIHVLEKNLFRSKKLQRLFNKIDSVYNMQN